MEEFYSIEQIKKEFKLKSTGKTEIRAELNQLRLKIHPDKNGGEFKTKNEETKYYRLTKAIEFLDNESDKLSLIPLKDVSSIIKVIRDLTPNNEENLAERKIEEKISDNLTAFKNKIKLPRIGLSVLTVIVTFLILFPNQLAQNPFLKDLLDERANLSILSCFWVLLLILTLIFWLTTYLQEEKQKTRLNNLKLESTQNNIFNLFTEFLDNKNERSFTKDDLTDFILAYMSGRNLRIKKDIEITSETKKKTPEEILRTRDSLTIGGSIIDNELAQIISEKIISRGEKKQIIEQIVDGESLSDVYTINLDNPKRKRIENLK